MRIDKFLWCVRLHKTRALAAEACLKGRVEVNERPAKPSVEVKAGDRLAVRVPPIWRRFQVKAVPASRMGAKLVPEHLEETTPWEDLEKLELARKVQAESRPAGEGRPTKRDRRDIDRFRGLE